MSGSQWPEVAKAVDGGLFVLAEAACLESRHPCARTPPGVGPLQRGDAVEVAIEGIGVLRNFVV